jgi:hypothetical protein
LRPSSSRIAGCIHWNTRSETYFKKFRFSVAAGNASLGIQQMQPVNLGIQYFIAALVLSTLLLMLVITIWSMRHTSHAAWIVFRSGLQLVQHRGRQLSSSAARPSPSGALFSAHGKGR